MSKRLFALTGLAILCVVANHAVGWVFTSMFWWTDQYRSVSVPNYDELGSAAYYVLVLVKQLTIFSVPAFLFVSGFFIAYAARSNPAYPNWPMLRSRIIYLVVPYVIWSCVAFVVDPSEPVRYPFMVYVERLLTGGAVPAYFYVPVICQLYLLSPWIMKLARKSWRWLLIGAAVIQFVALGSFYMQIADWPAAIENLLSVLDSSWLFPKWIFFFALGMVYGLRMTDFKTFIIRWRWPLLAVTFVCGVLAIVEPEFVYQNYGVDWRGGPVTFATSLYTIGFILCYLAFEKVNLPFTNRLTNLSSKSYGIYLIHPLVLGYVSRILDHTVPGLFFHPLAFFVLLVIVGMGIPLLLMSVVSRSPAKKAYRYLFG